MAEEQKPADNAALAEGGNKKAEGGEGAPDDKGTGAGEGGGDATKKSNGEVEKPTDGKPNADDGEPPTRKRSNLDFIIERKVDKAIKRKDKVQAGDEGGEGGDEGDDDEIAPEDAELIDKRVDSRLAPIIKKAEQDELKSEVTTFLTTNPDFKPYEAKILKFAAHPAYRDVPIDIIAAGIASKDLMRIGAERAKKADEDAKKTQTGGGSPQGDEGGSKYADMTPAEHTAELHKVLHKPR